MESNAASNRRLRPYPWLLFWERNGEVLYFLDALKVKG